MEEVPTVLGHSELLIPRPRCPESIEILNQMLFLARLQQHGLKQARRIRFYVIPAVVILVQVRCQPALSVMTGHDLIHKLLQKGLISTNGPEGQRLDAPLASAFGVIDLKGFGKRRSCLCAWGGAIIAGCSVLCRPDGICWASSALAKGYQSS